MQGPKADSFSHIWRMIWKENQNPAVVVMLTQTHETGREKCYPYYPQFPSNPDMRVNEQDEFEDGFIHNLHLVDLHQDDEARTQVREIDMTAEDDDEESRKIWHLLFAGWPDFSVPEGADQAALLKLIDISREKNGDNSTNPRIVHCSAGIGRSGTFIALDWLLQELDEGSLDETPDSADPIVSVVEKLRDQRAGMVQSKNQFVFLYDALRERWCERWMAAHPADAAQLGLSSASPDAEPALKRQKSMKAEDGTHSFVSDDASSPDARAALEAELMDADMSYEKGKT
jgi:protein-tyrosine phosphatase